MTWIFLSLAIVFEVGWAIAMKLSSGLTRPGSAAATILMYLLSLVFLALAVRRLDIGLAYALWAGAGAAIIALIGILHFKEPATALKLVSLALVIAGVIGLNLSGAGHRPVPSAP